MCSKIEQVQKHKQTPQSLVDEDETFPVTSDTANALLTALTNFTRDYASVFHELNRYIVATVSLKHA